MAYTDQDAQAEIDAYKAPDQPHPMAAAPIGPLQAAQQSPPATTTPSFLDSVVSHVDSFTSHYGKMFADYEANGARDVIGGMVTGAVNAADTAKSFLTQSGKGLAAAAIGESPSATPDAPAANAPRIAPRHDLIPSVGAGGAYISPDDIARARSGAGPLTATGDTQSQPAAGLSEDGQKMVDDAEATPDPITPIYNDARAAVLGVRDAIAVKDPGVADHLLEGAGQLVPSFLMFSRVMGAVHGLADLGAGGNLAARTVGGTARFVAADTPNSAIMQGPHDPRLADTVQLLRHSEGKLGDLLRAVAPDGSLQNRYIDYLADHGNETEAAGRFKNVLDSYGAGAAITGIMHTAGGVFKQSWNALHFMADNSMGSMSDIMPANQVGKIGYHGTAATIDPAVGFDDSKIGTGEGAQAFGYGHYIAENPATAETYRARLATSSLGAIADARDAVKTAGGDSVKAYKSLTSMAADEQDSGLRMRMQKAAAIIKNGNIGAGGGNKYTVDIPDEKIDAMLDHDKPMSEQPDVLAKIPKPEQDQVESFLDEHNKNTDLGAFTGGQFRQIITKMHEEDALVPADTMETNMSKATSQYLNARGIPGIKYLDRGSRSGGEGTRNFVLFNGRDARITEKNGESVRGEKQDMNLSKEERALEREREAVRRSEEN